MDLKQIRKHLFWIVMGAGALLLLVLYLTMYSSRAAYVDRLKRDVTANQGIFTEFLGSPVGRPDLRAWEDYRRKLDRSVEQTVDFYVKQDREFERWFPALGTPPENVPNPGTFINTHKDEQEKLDRLLRPDASEEPWNSGWVRINQEYLVHVERNPRGKGLEDVHRFMRDVQKMYWIRKRFARCLEPMLAKDRERPKDERMVRVETISWLRPITERFPPPQDFPVTSSRDFAEGREEWPGLPKNIHLRGFVLPRELGTSYTFRAKFRMALEDLPRFMSRFLAYDPFPDDPDPAMLIELIGLSVRTVETNEFSRKVTVREQDPPEKQEAELEKVRRTLRPKPVEVRIVARVLDPDAERFKKFLAEARKGPGSEGDEAAGPDVPEEH